MPEAIEEAFISILADTSRFDETLKEGVNDALKAARRLTVEVFKDMEKTGVEAALKIGFQLDQLGENPGLDELAQTLVRLRSDFGELGEAGIAAAERIERAYRDLESGIVTGPIDASRRLEEATERLGERIRASLGRTAVAGVNQLEASFEDIGETANREFDIVAASAREALGRLGNIPGLERLKAEFESLTDEIRGDFKESIEEAQVRLGNAFAAGEINAGEFRAEIIRTSNALTAELGQSLETIRRDLGLIAGDKNTFEAMAVDAARAARETRELHEALARMDHAVDRIDGDFHLVTDAINQAKIAAKQLSAAIDTKNPRLFKDALAKVVDQSDELRASLNRLDDAGHVNIIRDFRRAENELERLKNTAIETAAPIRRIGTVSRTAGRQSTDSFGHLVARLNRLRFVALDARFILSGIGVFAAAQFARFGIEATSQIEQVRLSFQTIAKQIEGDLGDSFNSFSDQAEVSLQRVIDFARETPFAITDVADAVRRIAAFLPSFQIATPEELDTLNERTSLSLEIFTDIGGALAVLGQQDALPRLVKALGDVGAAGKLTGEEVRQLRNALPGVNIREAIIKGIFDPTIRASDSIIFLREQFSSLGSDADTATQEATAAFVTLQRQGLITTDAVVQGLRASLRDLAGDEALENFTLTIQGSMEKVREALEVGFFEGARDLGKTLVDELLPALDDLEAVSERFAETLGDLAAASLPIAIEAFQDLSFIAGEVFEDLAEFAIRNRSSIERGIRSFSIAAAELSQQLFIVLDAVTPVIPSLLDVAVILLNSLTPALEAVAPLIRSVAETIDDLPAPLLATGTALFFVNRALSGANILAAAAVYGNIATSLGSVTAAVNTARAALLRFGPVAVAVFALDQIANLDKGKEAAEDFIEALSVETGSLPALEGTSTAIKSITDELNRLRDEAPDRTFFTDVGELLNPFFLRSNVNREQQIAGLKSELDRLGRTYERIGNVTIPAARTALVALGDEFNSGVLDVALTDDVVRNLAEALGVDLRGSLREVTDGFRTALPDSAALASELAAIGVALPALDFSIPAAGADQIAERFQLASQAVTELSTALLAQTDPFFAVIDARQKVTDAIADIAEAERKEFKTEEERNAAITGSRLAALQATIAFAASFGRLAEAAADENVGTTFQLVSDKLNSLLPLLGDKGPAAMDTFRSEFSAILADLPLVSDTLGLTEDQFGAFFEVVSEGLSSFEPKFRNSLTGMVEESGRFADDLRAEVANAENSASLNDIAKAFKESLDNLPTVFDQALGRLSSTMTTGNPALLTNAFTLGQLILERINAGLNSGSLRAPSLTSSPTNFRAPSSPAPPPTSSPTDNRTPSGFSVTQYISTSDPATAGRRSVQAFNNELFLSGGRF